MKLLWLLVAACIVAVAAAPTSLVAPVAGLVGMLCCVNIAFTEREEEDVLVQEEA